MEAEFSLPFLPREAVRFVLSVGDSSPDRGDPTLVAVDGVLAPAPAPTRAPAWIELAKCLKGPVLVAPKTLHVVRGQ